VEDLSPSSPSNGVPNENGDFKFGDQRASKKKRSNS
jgi:hypothetical protein